MMQQLSALIPALHRQLILLEIDVQGGLEAAKDAAIGQIKPIVNGIVIPAICIVLGVMLVFAIASGAVQKRQGQDYGDKVKAVAIILVALMLVGSSYLWLWQMVGV